MSSGRGIEALARTSIGGGASMDVVSSSTDGHQDPMPPAVSQERDSTGSNKVRSNKTQLLKTEENHSGNVEALMEQLRDLECKKEEIRNQEITVLHKLHRLEDNGQFLKGQIIGFVEAIEKANHYIEFKEYLKKEGFVTHDSDGLKVFKHLVKEKKVQATYDKLLFQDILDAVNEHIWSLKIERGCKDNQLQQIINTDSPYPDGQNKWFTLLELARTSRARIEDPIIDLVYYLRTKDYVLDQNPRVELDRIMNHNIIYFTHGLKARLLFNYSEKKVIVDNIPLDYDEDKVKASFSACGDIEEFEMMPLGDRWCNVAYVTFCDAEGAKLAPILKEEEFFTIYPFPEHKEYQSTELTKEFDKAMRKYSYIRRHSRKSFDESASQIRRRRRQKNKILKSYPDDKFIF